MTHAPIVVVGAQSRLGRSLALQLGARARLIARRAVDDAAGAVVSDYHAIAAADLKGASAVINCTGLVSGSFAALHQANVALPRLLATRSREAGVKRFVQISSFSVYGHAEEIAPSTPEMPVSDYGRTKLAGDHALADISASDFDPVMLRIPALVDTSNDNKLATLVRLAVRTRALPAPRLPVIRSMLSYDLAASVAASLADGEEHGVVLAADPMAFTYEFLAKCIEELTGRRIRRVPVPRFLDRAIELARPTLHASLLRSSRLPNEFNFVRESPIEAALPAIVTCLVKKMASVFA